MELFEYSVGIGGWIAVACLAQFIINRHELAFNPIFVAVMPCILILLTYLVILILRSIVYIIITVVYYMFRGEVIVTIMSCITTAALLFVITNTYKIINVEDEHVD